MHMSRKPSPSIEITLHCCSIYFIHKKGHPASFALLLMVWENLKWGTINITIYLILLYLNRLLEAQTESCVHHDPGERSSDPTRNWPRLAWESPGVSSGGVGQWWPAAVLGAVSVAVHAWDLIFITSTIAWPHVNSRGGTQLSWVQFSHSVMSNSLRPHKSQHTRPPCPSPTPGVYSNPCPSSRWCHPAISSSVVPFSSYPQSLPASGSFPISQYFASGSQSIGVSASASVLPMNPQDWSPWGWTGWISLQSNGFPRVFSNAIVQKHQFFSTQLSSQSNSHIHTWPLEKP